MSIRRKRGNVEAATDTYVKDGRTVTLVGVAHVASPTFWERTRALIAAKEDAGYEVQYEAVKNDLGRKFKLGPDLDGLAKFVGLESQFTGITYNREDWVCTDIRLSELVGNLSPEKLARVEEESAAFDITDPAYANYAKPLRWLMGYIHILDRLPIKTFGLKRADVVDKRDKAAFAGIKNTTRNVISIWGAAHLPGIGRHLLADGYHLAHREWVTAIPRNTK